MRAFVYRGPLAPKSTLFRGRTMELAQLTRLCLGEVQAYAIVYGGRQTGKTSLLLRLAAMLPEQIRTCRVDFQRVSGATTMQVYAYLAQRIAESLPCPVAIPPDLTDAPALAKFLCQALSQPEIGRLLLLIEELGALPPSSQTDLANFVRSVFNSRFDPSCWPLARLMVVLAGSIELHELAATEVSTLHNICEALYLPDLGEAEAVGLVTDGLTELGLSHPLAETLGQAVYAHVSGHPYLTQRLGGSLEDYLITGDSLTPTHVERAVVGLLRDDPLLDHLRKALKEKHLLAASQSLLTGHLRFSRLDEEMACLELLGLANAKSGHWKVRNTLLARALREWLPAFSKPAEDIATPFAPRKDNRKPVELSERASAPSIRQIYVTHIDHAEGIAIGDGARAERHDPAPGRGHAAPPGISVSLLTRIMPTAYCRQLNAEAFPLVTVTVDNTGQGCASVALRVSAIIENHSDTATASPLVSQGGKIRVPLLPLLTPTAVATLNEMRPATLRITVERTSPSVRTLYDQTERIHLHARDTALFAVRAPNGSIVDLTDYLAAWVTPRHPEVEKVLRQAAEYHPNKQLVGYQGASTLAQGAEIVREQARAIFTALKQDAKVIYVSSPLNLGKQADQVTQRVRLPAESLATGSSANCIDGTVLFASLIELTSIDPLIVIVPGHAFVGWRIWRDINQYEFLETTMIGSNDFDAAQQVAQVRYDDARMKGHFSRRLFDPGGSARLIDVAACRAKGIYPLE